MYSKEQIEEIKKEAYSLSLVHITQINDKEAEDDYLFFLKLYWFEKKLNEMLVIMNNTVEYIHKSVELPTDEEVMKESIRGAMDIYFNAKSNYVELMKQVKDWEAVKKRIEQEETEEAVLKELVCEEEAIEQSN